MAADLTGLAKQTLAPVGDVVKRITLACVLDSPHVGFKNLLLMSLRTERLRPFRDSSPTMVLNWLALPCLATSPTILPRVSGRSDFPDGEPRDDPGLAAAPYPVGRPLTGFVRCRLTIHRLLKLV